MSLLKLIIKEALHRRLNTLLGLLAVIAAAACVVGSLVMLASFDLETERIVRSKEKALEDQMQDMKDSYRKITKNMGFNVLILPAEQNIGDFHAENYASKFMPEEYAHRLADAKGIVTIRHLLPMLQQKIEWPEQKRKILLIGVQGEMAWTHRTNMKPIVKPVPPGTTALGYELHRSLGLKEGETVTLMGKDFTVGALHPERGTIDDITLWIDLEESQELLDKKGLINSITALECECAWADLAKVREEIQVILPDTQVIELSGKAIARAEARREAEKNATLAIAREKEGRELLREKREGIISVLVPLVIAGTALLLALLALANVRERRVEVGILRALGLRTKSILFIFLAKSAVIGLIGGAAGVVAGIAAALSFALPEGSDIAAVVPSGLVMLLILCAAPVITTLSGWIPALAAAQQDPAVVLREE